MSTASSDVVQIQLDEVLDISTVGELRNILLLALEDKQPVRLAGTDIARADTAALQMLSAFIKDAKAQAQEVAWEAPSAALLEAAQLLGLSGVLGLEVQAG